MPAVLMILVVFAAMLLVVRARVPLVFALLGGGLALNAWAGFGPDAVLTHFGDAVADPEVWLMIAVTVLIVEVGRFMTEGSNADRLQSTMRRWGGRHAAPLTIMILPALVGLIPMPAGAVVSAPLVNDSGRGEGLSLEWKAAVNYWFRHLWEYWWPLYPAVILTFSIFRVEPLPFFLAQVPFTLVTVAAGYFVLVRPRRAALVLRQGGGDGGGGLAGLLAPFAVVVAALLGLPPLLVRAGMPDATETKLWAMLAGLAVAQVMILRHRRTVSGSWPTLRQALRPLLAPRELSVLASLGGVLVFNGLLESSALLPKASRELLGSGIPPEIALVALPFLAGFVTGAGVGMAGMALPLVAGLMQAPSSGLPPLATLVLSYGFGYIGIMLSPVHLCLLVTRDYFGARLAGIYREFGPCCALVLAYTLVAHLALRALGW